VDADAWARTRDDLLRHHPLARELAGEIRFVLVFESIRVGVRVLPLAGAAVQVLAEVARLDGLEAVDALRWNAELAVGAVALVADVYVVRCVVDDLDGLERLVLATAASAALMKKLTGRTADAACCGIAFSNFAE
jgi:hypothetical protein